MPAILARLLHQCIHSSYKKYKNDETRSNHFRRRAACPQLHRVGRPEEVAQAVLFLVRNDYITGEVVTVEGGLTMRIA